MYAFHSILCILFPKGFLERLGTLLLHQHFCDGSNIALNKEGLLNGLQISEDE